MLNTSLFYNKLDNLIFRISQIDENQNFTTWFGNAGEMVTKGAEISLMVRPIYDLNFDLSVTYQETEDLRKEFKDIKVAYSPNFLGYMKASYTFLQNMTFVVTANYVGEMIPFYDETIMNADSTFGARIGDKVDGNLLLGANLRMNNLFKRGVYVNIKCNNVLGTEIRYPTTSSNDWANKGYLGAGRSFLVSFGKEF